MLSYRAWQQEYGSDPHIVGSSFMLDGQFRACIAAQGGDVGFIDDPDLLGRPASQEVVSSEDKGYIYRLDAKIIGKAAMVLGAGRERPGEPVDPTAGITLLKKIGDPVRIGDPVFILQAGTAARIDDARVLVKEAMRISPTFIPKEEQSLERIHLGGSRFRRAISDASNRASRSN